MQQQIAEPVKLALPRQGSVLYVQIHEDWLVVPPDVPMIKQGVLLTPSTDYYGQQYTDFSINVPGGVSDIGGFHWPTNDRE